MPFAEGSTRSGETGSERSAAVPTRRTVTIRGQVAGRHRPRMVEVDRRRPPRSARERAMSRPDRIALWAVLLCLLLVVAAAASAHAAIRAQRTAAPLAHLAAPRP